MRSGLSRPLSVIRATRVKMGSHGDTDTDRMSPPGWTVTWFLFQLLPFNIYHLENVDTL